MSNSNWYDKVAEIHSILNRNKIINNHKQQVYEKVAKLEIFKSIIISNNNNNNITSDLQVKRTYIKCTLTTVLHKEQKSAAKQQYSILKETAKSEWYRFRVNLIWFSKQRNSSNFRSYLKQALQLQDQLHLVILLPQLISQTTQDRTQQVTLNKTVPALVIVRSERSHWVWLPTHSPPNRILSSNNSSSISSNKTPVIFSRWRDRPQPARKASWQGKTNSKRVRK